MGSVVSTTCRKCGKEESFKLGIGMMSISLRDANCFAVAHSQRARIDELLEYEGEVSSKHEYKLFECKKCNILHGRFYVKVLHDGVEVYETGFKCGKCWSKLVPAEKEIESYNCRRCGRKALKKYDYNCWD